MAKTTIDWKAIALKSAQAANTEINTGRKFIFGPTSLPAGRTVKYFYLGVPGIWAVDEKGSHWCAGPSDPCFDS